MCIVFLAFSNTPKEDGYKVIIASNRDEYFNRPTQEAHFWKDNPDIISGIDLFPQKEGGTWLGMSRNGQIGILTNYRQGPSFSKNSMNGRGELVTCYLKSDNPPRTYVEKVKQTGQDYNGFNLIVGKISTITNFSYYCNQENRPVKDLHAGIYCLSNRYLDYGWKKVALGKEKFGQIIQMQCSMSEKINLFFEMLQDKTRYPDDELFVGPQDVGVSRCFIEGCSATSVFIPGNPCYGTRSNTVIIVDAEDNVTYIEQSMEEPIDVDDIHWKTNTFDFKISP